MNHKLNIKGFHASELGSMKFNLFWFGNTICSCDHVESLQRIGIYFLICKLQTCRWRLLNQKQVCRMRFAHTLPHQHLSWKPPPQKKEHSPAPASMSHPARRLAIIHLSYMNMLGWQEASGAGLTVKTVEWTSAEIYHNCSNESPLLDTMFSYWKGTSSWPVDVDIKLFTFRHSIWDHTLDIVASIVPWLYILINANSKFCNVFI